MRFTRVTTAVLALVAACAAVSPAQADIGNSPADSIAQAFGPLAPLTDYSGAFRSAEDIDYASFVVDHAPETLHFDVSNTVGRCTSVVGLPQRVPGVRHADRRRRPAARGRRQQCRHRRR